MREKDTIRAGKKNLTLWITINEPQHESSNNVVCATSKPQISLCIHAV